MTLQIELAHVNRVATNGQLTTSISHEVNQPIGAMWIKETIEALSGFSEYDKDLDAKSLHDNPLVVWGAAALEGFFTDEEMHEVASYLRNTYGSFVDRPDVLKIMGQAEAMVSLVAQYLKSHCVERFVRLCAYCGLVFQVCDMKGEIVADGLKIVGQSGH